MYSRIPVHAGLILLVGLTACTSGDRAGDRSSHTATDQAERVAAASSTGGLEVVHGHYSFAHETRALRPCGRDGALWVIDRTDLLRKLHGELAPGTVPDAEVFAVVAGRTGPSPAEGFGADYPGSLTVEDVIYVAFEGFGCDFDWSRFVYRAQGNEPFWMLEVLPAELRLTRPGEPDLSWTAVERSRTDRAVVFRGTDDDVSPVELVIEAGHSRDTMSGAFYGLSARLKLGGQTLQGQALRGQASETPVDERKDR